MDAVDIHQLVHQLVMALVGKLNQYEDIDTAIAVYKEIGGFVDQLGEVRAMARDLARSCLESDGLSKHKSTAGTCGWTAPKTPKLDKDAWAAALAVSSELRDTQALFDEALAMLSEAQKPYGRLPDPTFYIR